MHTEKTRYGFGARYWVNNVLEHQKVGKKGRGEAESATDVILF